jgi:hypothetical protein
MTRDFVARDGIESLGSILFPYSAKTTTYTIGNEDYFIDCTSGTFTVTLPTGYSSWSIWKYIHRKEQWCRNNHSCHHFIPND